MNTPIHDSGITSKYQYPQTYESYPARQKRNKQDQLFVFLDLTFKAIILWSEDIERKTERLKRSQISTRTTSDPFSRLQVSSQKDGQYLEFVANKSTYKSDPNDFSNTYTDDDEFSDDPELLSPQDSEAPSAALVTPDRIDFLPGAIQPESAQPSTSEDITRTSILQTYDKTISHGGLEVAVDIDSDLFSEDEELVSVSDYEFRTPFPSISDAVHTITPLELISITEETAIIEPTSISSSICLNSPSARSRASSDYSAPSLLSPISKTTTLDASGLKSDSQSDDIPFVLFNNVEKIIEYFGSIELPNYQRSHENFVRKYLEIIRLYAGKGIFIKLPDYLVSNRQSYTAFQDEIDIQIPEMNTAESQVEFYNINKKRCLCNEFSRDIERIQISVKSILILFREPLTKEKYTFFCTKTLIPAILNLKEKLVENFRTPSNTLEIAITNIYKIIYLLEFSLIRASPIVSQEQDNCSSDTSDDGEFIISTNIPPPHLKTIKPILKKTDHLSNPASSKMKKSLTWSKC